MDRREFLSLATAAGIAGPLLDTAAWASAGGGDAVTIGWPNDVPSWDPNQRFSPDSQPLFKLVFDQPLDQSPKLELIPNLITRWEASPDGKALTIDLRDDVTFHDGSKMTAEDFRYTFKTRIEKTPTLDTKNSFGRVQEVEIVSPTRCVLKFASPYVTAPQWMAFLGSYVVPEAYLEKVGLEQFRQKPIGTGPYRLAEYELNSRMVFERYDSYWGAKPKIRRVTVNVIKDPAARVAALRSGQVDLTINLPMREVDRLAAAPNIATESYPFTRVILLQQTRVNLFEDENVRLAAHHAIDKAALSKAFYNGVAVPISVPATPGSPGWVDDWTFPHDEAKAKELLAKSGFSVDKPAKITLGTTNGHFPADYDIARAIVQMWKKVGIEATLDVVEYGKYFELNRASKLPETFLYSWDNASGDPEIFAGYLLNPKLPMSAWKDPALGEMIDKLFATTDYAARMKGYKELERKAVEMGASTPLLQSIVTVGRNKNLNYTRYDNGWVMAKTMSWS